MRGAPQTRLQSLVADLKVDGTVTLKQAQQHYHLPSELVLSTLPSRTMQVRPLRSSAQSVSATFIALEEGELRYAPGWALAHTAGTAALRHLLGVKRGEWEREASFGTHRADATWHRPGQGLVAIEYDAGYGPATVKEKLKAFSEVYEAVVWGTTSSARANHIEGKHAAPRRHFVQVDW